MLKKIIFIFLIVILITLNYYPVNMAIRELPSDGTYLVVEQQKVTGFDWYVAEDSTGTQDAYSDITLSGNVPPFDMPDAVYEGQNTFVCFGEYEEEDIMIDEQVSKVFRVDEWHILYPVKRQGLRPNFINPQYATNVWDY